jgi:hypothetical protein
MNTMNRLFQTTKVLSWLAAVAVCSPVLADGQGARSLEGTWDIVATVHDCDSGATIRSIPRMITFAMGGTLAEFTAGGTDAAPVNRGVGQGAWEYLGDGQFTYRLKFMLLTPAGGPNGFFKEVRYLEVFDEGNKFLAEGTSGITFANGVQGPQFCTTEDGTRLY